MSDIVFVIPSDREYSALRSVQGPTFEGVAELLYMREKIPVPGVECPILGRWIEGYKQAVDIVGPDGFVALGHHDMVLDNKDALHSLMDRMVRDGIAVAGQSECDRLMRHNQNGQGMVHSWFMVTRPKLLGRWWEVDQWIDNGWVTMDGKVRRCQGMEFYWKLSLDAKGNILFLPTRWREPRLGNATELWYDGCKMATHLWLSTAQERVIWKTIEGNSREDIERWRDEWIRAYSAEWISAYSADACPA